MPEDVPEFPLLQRALRKIRLVFDTWYPWDQRRIAKRIVPLTIRRLEESDLEWCERLYHLNESFGIPADRELLYHNYLRSDDTLKLIAEDSSGGRIATFGLFWYGGKASNIGYLCYLLVDPGAHRRGVGTTLVISALSMLGTDMNDKFMALSALDPAIHFYRRLGFESRTGEEYGLKVNFAVLGPLEASLLHDCRKFLTQAGVTIPDLSHEIPSAKPPQVPSQSAA